MKVQAVLQERLSAIDEKLDVLHQSFNQDVAKISDKYALDRRDLEARREEVLALRDSVLRSNNSNGAQDLSEPPRRRRRASSENGEAETSGGKREYRDLDSLAIEAVKNYSGEFSRKTLSKNLGIQKARLDKTVDAAISDGRMSENEDRLLIWHHSDEGSVVPFDDTTSSWHAS